MTKEEFIKRAQEKFKDRFTFKELPERFYSTISPAKIRTL